VDLPRHACRLSSTFQFAIRAPVCTDLKSTGHHTAVTQQLLPAREAQTSENNAGLVTGNLWSYMTERATRILADSGFLRCKHCSFVRGHISPLVTHNRSQPALFQLPTENDQLDFRQLPIVIRLMGLTLLIAMISA
jgi:hypothetical protein